MTPSRLPAPPITRTCRQRPCSRPAPSAQPLEAPAPRPRSGIVGLPAHGLWPELTVATGSSRSSFVHTAPGYLCPCRHSQAVKPQWFGRTLTRCLVKSARWSGPGRVEPTSESDSDRPARPLEGTAPGDHVSGRSRRQYLARAARAFAPCAQASGPRRHGWPRRLWNQAQSRPACSLSGCNLLAGLRVRRRRRHGGRSVFAWA